VEYTQFGRTGLNVSRVSYGTWEFGGDWGRVAADQWETGKATVRKALDLGINLFDTAQAYGFGQAERLLGEALQSELSNQRERVILATKGGLRMDGGTLRRDASARWLRQGVEESLRNLGVDYIDIYYLHWPDPATPMEETASALARLADEGKIRYVGVSNFDAAQMQQFERTRKIDVLQPPYSLFRRDIEQAILPYCQERGIAVAVYGPLAHGMLAGTFTPQTSFPSDDWRSKNPYFQGNGLRQNLAVVERLKALASHHGMTLVQLAVAWVLANPAVQAAIVGAHLPSHLEQTAAAAQVHLTPEMLGETLQIMRDAEPIGGPAPEGMPSS
jgi:aryl-alcohol dehydrogenase-like predicted oxidoreductase